MIRNLRLKFIAVFMALNTVFAAALVVVSLLSARDNLEQISVSVLRRVLNEPYRPDRSDRQDGPDKSDSPYGPDKPDRPDGPYGPDSPDALDGGEAADAVALPYFVVEQLGDAYYMTKGTYSDLANTDMLDAIVEDCLSRQEPEGVLPAYGLRYLRREYGWHKQMAFVDMSMERTTLRRLFTSWLLTALTALLPLLALSILLSRWVAAPVERAWRQQRQFLSDASHELKTPLTVILSNADLLDAADLPDRPRRWVDNIRTESRRMRNLVEEMLSLARADSAAGGAVQGEVSLSDVAADCALSFEPVAFEAGKPLEYEIAPGVLVTGDGEKLRRLASVLLDNAIKYGAEGGTIVLTLDKIGREARLCVSNPGEPIPAADLPRLFERFYRGDASRGEQSGFGLGLSIAAAVAREHRGTLRAESDETSTRFLFSMPLARPGKGRREAETQDSQEPAD